MWWLAIIKERSVDRRVIQVYLALAAFPRNATVLREIIVWYIV